MHLSNRIQLYLRSWAGIPGGGGSKVHGLTLGNGWTILGGPVKGSTGVL